MKIFKKRIFDYLFIIDKILWNIPKKLFEKPSFIPQKKDILFSKHSL
jgi:hypothetical protein